MEGLKIRDGQIIDTKELATLAREAREQAGHTQADTAALLKVSQPVVSGAENGKSQYVRTCIRMIEHYTDFEVIERTFQLKRKSTGGP